MKRLIFFLTLLAISMPLSTTAPTSHDASMPENGSGPYFLSFDMGLPSTDYTINETGPYKYQQQNGSISVFEVHISSNIKPQVTLISMQISEDNPSLLTANELEQMIHNEIENATDIRTATLVIDNSVGVLASYNLTVANISMKSYSAIYQPSFDQGRSLVVISSNFPWDQGTSQLLNTIQVYEATGMEVPSQPTGAPSTVQPSYAPVSSATITNPSYSPQLWINTASGGSTYAQCSSGGTLQLLLYLPRGGYVGVHEIYPNGVSTVSNYYFNAGESIHMFKGDVSGRHELYLTSGNEESNKITIDVI